MTQTVKDYINETRTTEDLIICTRSAYYDEEKARAAEIVVPRLENTIKRLKDALKETIDLCRLAHVAKDYTKTASALLAELEQK